MTARNGLLVLVAGLALGLANAAPGGASVAPRHCVVWISPVDPQTGHSHLSALRCFARFGTAQRVAREAAPAGFRSAGSEVVPDVSTRISIDYDSSGFTGSTLTWTVANSFGCVGGSYQAGSMPSGWNDRVSSAHSYGGCSVNAHYHDANFLGSGINCTCSTMGTMSNQTSSETWNS
jgi:hypothetical protein